MIELRNTRPKVLIIVDLGRSGSGVHDNTLLPIPSIMNRASRFGPPRKMKVSDASELAESMVLRRKLLVKEHCESYHRGSPNSAGLNSDNDVIDINSTSRGNEIDEDEFRHWQDVQHEQQMNTVVGDPCAFARNNLHELGEDVLLKTMGWFPVEEHSNEDSETTRSLHWILDEPPSASDLPHLENLMEMSPSKFWSPRSESKNRPPVQFGYFNLSESPQSSHSIHYFLNDSPTLSTEVTRTILGCASGVRNSNLGCSPLCRNIYAQNVLTPICVSRKLAETSMKSPSLGPERKLAAQDRCAGEICPALSEGNATKIASPEHNMATPVYRDHTHPQETGTVAKSTASNPAARRLQLCQRGKNLVVDFLEVGETEGEARRTRNDTPPRDMIVQSPTAFLTKSEKTSDQMRLQCLAEHSTKDRESALPSSELQNICGAAGNGLTERASQIHQNGTRERAVPSVPISNFSKFPNLATSLRYSLHEELESQLPYLEPLSEPLKNERLVTFQCPEPTHDNFAWSNPAVPRVSRKRSNRITTPKLTRVDIFKLLGNGKVAQPVRTTPVKSFYTCQRRKRTRKRTLEELPTAQRNVKLKSTSTRDCEIDMKEMGVQEGTSSNKPPTLTRIIKPLLHMKTSPPKGDKTKWTLRSTVTKGLLTDPQNVNVMQYAPTKIPNDVTEAVVIPGQNPVSSRSTNQKQRVEEESSQTAPDDSSMSNINIDSDMSNTRSSKYRGVTRHRHTGRYEAHLWDNTKLKQGLAKRGRQVYLGAYTNEDQAAQAHDLAALKYWGSKTYTNFPLTLYEKELETLRNFTREEYIVLLRRRSPGFTRGVSKYRGVTRHHQEGRWEARIGRHSGAKYHYLGTYDTQEEAAAAYDRAAVRNRGINAITNFDISNYIKTISKAHSASESPTSSSESL